MASDLISISFVYALNVIGGTETDNIPFFIQLNNMKKEKKTKIKNSKIIT